MNYIVTSESVSLFHNGKMHSVSKMNNPTEFKALSSALKANDEEKVGIILNGLEVGKTYANGAVKITEDGVTYNGKPVAPELQRYLVNLLKEGFSLDPWVKFIESLYRNPSFKLVQDGLFKFLLKHNRPITENGGFLADKGVRNDYMDQHSGSIYNGVGTVVSVPRNEVDDNPDRTCSFGLHVGNYDYVASFGSRKLLCEVMPEDVVSVPADYNHTKMRVCKYKVIAEITDDYSQRNLELSEAGVYVDNSKSTAPSCEHMITLTISGKGWRDQEVTLTKPVLPDMEPVSYLDYIESGYSREGVILVRAVIHDKEGNKIYSREYWKDVSEDHNFDEYDTEGFDPEEEWDSESDCGYFYGVKPDED